MQKHLILLILAATILGTKLADANVMYRFRFGPHEAWMNNVDNSNEIISEKSDPIEDNFNFHMFSDFFKASDEEQKDSSIENIMNLAETKSKYVPKFDEAETKDDSLDIDNILSILFNDASGEEQKDESMEKTFHWGNNFLSFKFSERNFDASDFGLETEEKEGTSESATTTTSTSTISPTTTTTTTEYSIIPTGTEAPLANEISPTVDILSKQQQLNEIAYEKLQKVLDVLSNLKHELQPLSGSNYLIDMNIVRISQLENDIASVKTPDSERKFELLQKFGNLVGELQNAELQGGPTSLEFTLMQLALHKHNLVALQLEIEEQVFEAQEVWEHFLQKQLIEVAV